MRRLSSRTAVWLRSQLGSHVSATENKTEHNCMDNTLAFQVVNFILVSLFKFIIQIYVIRIFLVSTMFVRIGNQVFDLSANKDNLAYSASELTCGGCIPDKCQIVKPVYAF